MRHSTPSTTSATAATAPTYGAACFFALRTDALALVPAEVAREAERWMPLVALGIPLDLPRFPSGQAWHVRLDTDPAHRWLRGALARVAKEVRCAVDASG
jgi:DNA-binding transcriptional LysR family regulator